MKESINPLIIVSLSLNSRFNKDGPKKAGKRCPECFLMSERAVYCPCDNFDLFDTNNYNLEAPGRPNYCAVSMSECINR